MRQPSPIQIMIDQKRPENVEYLNYLGSSIINDSRCTLEVKSRIVTAKAALNKKKNLFPQQTGLKI
jgi:predicted RNA-binding protein